MLQRNTKLFSGWFLLLFLLYQQCIYNFNVKRIHTKLLKSSCLVFVTSKLGLNIFTLCCSELLTMFRKIICFINHLQCIQHVRIIIHIPLFHVTQIPKNLLRFNSVKLVLVICNICENAIPRYFGSFITDKIVSFQL